MLVTKDLELWLENHSDTDLELNAGELFGYGLGSFSEQPLGQG